MCGIVGVVDYEGRYPTERLQALTRSMRDTLTHRGPDDAGLWTSPDGRVCFGHSRLSILDRRLEGRQPMLNEDGRVAVTFNGEIYNFQQLRRTLEDAGHRFVSRTDTEVLCHLFEDGAPAEVVAKLRGMFAFGAWRTNERELILARDPFGKKPLYYVRHGAFLAFASELRALMLLDPDLLDSVDPAAVQTYLLLQYIPAPKTIYRHVRKLEPGTYLHLGFDPSRLRFARGAPYFHFDAREPSPQPHHHSPEQLVEALRTHLLDAVQARLVADVPIGAFLSGGNDSALIVALMARELGLRPKTYSVGFTNARTSEHLAARQIAQHLGTDHHELLVEPAALDLLPAIVDALDEPNGDSSCLPVYLLSQFARRDVTVALSGDGGDEMFGGYDRYTHTIGEAASLRRRLGWLKRQRSWWTAGTAYLSERILPMPEATLRTLVEHVEPEVIRLLDEMRAATEGAGPVLHRLRTLDARTYLPGAVLAKVDRMSMRFGLEVRCPFLDAPLAAWAQHLPASALNDGTTGKKIVKQLALRYLPAELVNRPKQGFGVPDQCWSQSRLLDRADALLTGPDCRLHAYLDPQRLRAHLERQRDPGRFHVYQVWELLVLEQWLRKASSLIPAAAAIPSFSRETPASASHQRSPESRG